MANNMNKDKIPILGSIDKLYLRFDNKFIIYFCIPESLNTNISHQRFDYKITFLNFQHKNTNSIFY